MLRYPFGLKHTILYINLSGVSNIVNSTKDLEWFMTQFIRKYEEMAELYDADVVDNELEELKINLSVTEEALKFNEDKLEELEGKYNTLRDMYLELYVMYIQAKNKGKIDKSMKTKHREFRKKMTDDKVYDEIELPF